MNNEDLQQLKALALAFMSGDDSAKGGKYKIGPIAILALIEHIESLVAPAVANAAPADETEAFEAWALTEAGNWDDAPDVFDRIPSGAYLQGQLQNERNAFAAGAAYAHDVNHRAAIAATTQEIRAVASSPEIPDSSTLTDKRIGEIFDELGGVSGFCKNFGYLQFARAIEEASGPNVVLVEALQRVSAWELPATGKEWPSGGAVSYTAEYGSEGARDYIIGVAADALAAAGATQPKEDHGAT